MRRSPLWRRRLPGYAAMGAATLAMALGLHGLMSARTTVAGTLLPLADADAATYGIRAVCPAGREHLLCGGRPEGLSRAT